MTSFMHSLNPALYFPRTVGSVFRAAVICARCMFRRCFTVISRISAFSSFECLELSFFRASRISVLSCPKLSLILARLLFSIMGLDDFLCSEAVLGLSGVVFMLAGVAATGDEEFFSIMSAGIFCCNIPEKRGKVWKKRREILRECSVFSGRQRCACFSYLFTSPDRVTVGL